MAKLNLYYGWHSEAIDQNILAGDPDFEIDCSPVGPWHGNANIALLATKGIRFMDYLDGGYEGLVPGPIPNDIASNLAFIEKIAAAGAYAIFLDQVTAYPAGPNGDQSKFNYLKQISDKAHGLGLKVVFNCGTDVWDDRLMDYCDILNSSEVWNNAPLTPSQQKWANRVFLLTQGVQDLDRAVTLTKAALEKGILAHFACGSYGVQPSWLVQYLSQIEEGGGPGDMAQITVIAPSEVKVGDSFEATLQIDTVTAFDAGQFDVLFDPTAMAYDSVVSGKIGDTVIPIAISSMIQPGRLRVILNVPGIPGVSGSGYLAVLKFKAVTAGDKVITIENGFLNDNQAVEIASSWEGCLINFFLRGDINGDGLVNTADISYLERIIVGLEPSTPKADLNGDGKINTADITELERIIAGQ